MDTPSEITRIQSYLRNVARSQYESIEIEPFTLFFHPSEVFKYYNYAIPSRACGPEIQPRLAALRREFTTRRRTPRFEFFEAFAPDLPAALQASGFIEEGRQWSMLCSRASFQIRLPGPGITQERLSPQSSRADALGFLQVQQEAFSPGEPHTPGEEEIDQALRSFSRRSAFLSRVEGEPAGAASYSQVIEGITEVTGIATRPAFRRQGIATALTSLAVVDAFEHGVLTICLTAEDERAGLVYQKVGFEPFSIMLAYIDL